MTHYEAYYHLARRVATTLRAHHLQPTSELVRDLTDLCVGGTLDQTLRMGRGHSLEPARPPDPNTNPWGEAAF